MPKFYLNLGYKLKKKALCYSHLNNTVDILDRNIVMDLKSATKLFSVLLASKRPLITELADKLRLIQ